MEYLYNYYKKFLPAVYSAFKPDSRHFKHFLRKKMLTVLSCYGIIIACIFNFKNKNFFQNLIFRFGGKGLRRGESS
ncbi:hypothetical protein PTH_2642 [Pelotomaculum thermopropionicum SI]|uniref:Uncharacterized protein n=1 Tax=Pelotomaculum thermopropionicum (strain DSM 13744 / JCM 10971 / SI) TaxID=370438 RepID=A5CYX6_PELTS|nr:hypothetical protein PTH_2642 [Pelotomaculum thermopropionicum SI]